MSAVPSWIIPALTSLLVASCSAPPADPGLPPDSGEVPRSVESPGSATGRLEGEVVFVGEKIPRSTLVQNTTDPFDCAPVQSLQNFLVSPAGGVQNVILHLPEVSLPEGARPPPARLVVENRDCQFQPHVAVIGSGSRLEAVNHDPFFHSVHLYGAREANLGLGPGQSGEFRSLERPGYYQLRCDVHGWMKAFLRVDRHPFHGVTDSEGRFRMEGVPAGSHLLEAWHEVFGTQEVRVEIPPGGTGRITIVYREGSF